MQSLQRSEVGNKIYSTFQEILERQGIDSWGVVDLAQVKTDFLIHRERYRDWIEKGYHGKMSYLERGMPRRLEPTSVFPAAKSVFVFSVHYSPAPLGVAESGVRYARYLRGEDYHERLKRLCNSVLEELRKSIPELEWKSFVDTSAVLERTWGVLSGLGWIGKNTLLIHPKKGSYSLLGGAFLNLEFENAVQPLRDYCGNCRRCIEVCPTQAILDTHEVDARRCISYLTLEKRGDWNEATEFIDRIGNWVAGCDLCQEVCPFNQKVTRSMGTPESKGEPEFELSLERLLNESQSEYEKRVSSVALNYVSYSQFQRNVAAVHSHSVIREND